MNERQVPTIPQSRLIQVQFPYRRRVSWVDLRAEVVEITIWAKLASRLGVGGEQAGGSG